MVCILPFFYTQITRECFHQLYFSGTKFTALFICELSGWWYINYHTFYKEVIGVCYNNFFFSRSKIIVMFVCDLSDLWLINLSCSLRESYRVCYNNKRRYKGRKNSVKKERKKIVYLSRGHVTYRYKYYLTSFWQQLELDQEVTSSYGVPSGNVFDSSFVQFFLPR